MKKLFLVFISAVGTGLAFLSPGFSFLVWVSLTPLFFLLAKKFSLKRAALFFLFGFIYYGLVVHWVIHVTFLGYLLLVFYLASYYLFFYLAANFFIRKPLNFLSLPAVWVIIEFIKEIVWCGFGWANLGYSQFKNLYLIQAADIGGAKLISFAIVLANFLLWQAVSCRKVKKKKGLCGVLWLKLVSFFLVLAVLATYSFFRIGRIKEDKKIGVSLIQPNIPGRYLLSQKEKKEVIKELLLLAKRAPEENLVIFSEAAWPYTLGENDISRLKNFVSESKRDILMGAVRREDKKYYNSALFLNRRGNLVEVYDKIILVPFGEFVPLRQYLGFIEVLNQVGDITPGKKISDFLYQDKVFSVLICFEDIVPLFAAKASRGKNFLVNITDDSWFEGNPQATQHLAIMVLRAVENRISIVRAANTGISGWVSPQGRFEKFKKNSESLFVRGKKNFEIFAGKKKSFYNRYGEWLVFLSFIFLLSIALTRGSGQGVGKR